MAQIIAGMYEIERKIGSGGGGIVYLGRHIRLNKTVVLKADRRKLSASEETLRREVDMLKNLSHTYIPQVYDFVQDGEDVYTVMDFIDGENLDEFMSKAKRISQPQLISWARQLLEALDYLHKQPPHGILHGDIKPANIMARPNGTICLIDYNIALALGEDGAVRVGFSRGYASPEHYGADYIVRNKSAGVGMKSYSSAALDDTKTEILAENVPVIAERYAKQNYNSSSENVSKKEILLDARSDIYSLGATLYYLISGVKPDEDARKVAPLGKDICNPEISAIIKKAMEPQPDDRYQTAEEMLLAFHNIYKNDHRVVRHKRKVIITVAGIAVMLAVGGFCTFVGLSQMKQRENALVLSEYSGNALDEGDVTKAISYALKAIPSDHGIFHAPVTAQAQKALTDALGVYELSDAFVPLDVKELPAAPFHIELSPDGDKAAVTYAYEVIVFDIRNQRQVVTLPLLESALSDAVFINDNMLAYAAPDGLSVFDLDTRINSWTGKPATFISVSGDGEKIAAVYKGDTYATIYQAADGRELYKCDFNGKDLSVVTNDIFADPQDEIFSFNEDGTILAVSFSDGGLSLFDVQNMENSIVIYDESEYSHFEGGFYGQEFFAFAADGTKGNVFEIIDIEDAFCFADYESQDELHLKIHEGGIFLADENVLSKINPETMEETEAAYLQTGSIVDFSISRDYVMIGTSDNKIMFYSAGADCIKEIEYDKCPDFVALSDHYAITANHNDPCFKMLKLNRNTDAEVFSYDASANHDEARISSDEQFLMLFNYQKFWIFDVNGQKVADVDLPDAEQIYDQQFIRDNEECYLEVIWYDGSVKCYSAQDGHIISEEKREKPDKSLDEEFYTQTYRVVSSLHKAPLVYDRKDGRLIGRLNSEDYLTYVTEYEGALITEYVNTDGERYGLLLDSNLETIACLPDLCDIKDHTLYFDDHTGHVKFSKIYTLDELLDLADEY